MFSDVWPPNHLLMYLKIQVLFLLNPAKSIRDNNEKIFARHLATEDLYWMLMSKGETGKMVMKGELAMKRF